MRRYCTINGEFESRRDQKYGLEYSVEQFVFVQRWNRGLC
jgi:hypothetical protein